MTSVSFIISLFLEMLGQKLNNVFIEESGWLAGWLVYNVIVNSI